MKTVSLLDFALDVQTALDGFLDAYYKKYKKDSNGYPLCLEEDNAGIWNEMFEIYCTTGEV